MDKIGKKMRIITIHLENIKKIQMGITKLKNIRNKSYCIRLTVDWKE